MFDASIKIGESSDRSCGGLQKSEFRKRTAKRNSRQLLPTPLSPIRSNLNKKSLYDKLLMSERANSAQ